MNLKLALVAGTILAAAAAPSPVRPLIEPNSDAPPPTPVKLTSSAFTLIPPVAEAPLSRLRISQVLGPFNPLALSNVTVPVASIRRMLLAPLRFPTFNTPDCWKFAAVK